MTPTGAPSLEGLRVLEVTGAAGQLCGKLLAGLGADVVKVEPPGGAETRRVGPFYQDVPHPDRSLSFWHYNVGKRGVTLDLDAPEGRALFRRLAATADVLLESEPPGRMAARGLGYDDLAPQNPGLIYCAVTPYGQTGPWSQRKATDLTLLASGGQMGVCGYDPDDDPDDTPIAPGGGNGWHIGDHYACIAILIALHHRDLTGAGDFIDLSVHDAIALCTEIAFPYYVMTGQDLLRQTGRHAGLSRGPKNQFRCRDGRYVNCFFARVKPEEWLRLREWLDEHGLLPDDLRDDRYLDPDELRGAMPRVLAAVERLCSTLTADEIFHGGQQRKFAWTVVRAPSELLGDPQLEARGFFVEVDHPELGRRFTYPGAPVIMHGTPWRLRKRAPLVGEDNVAILHQELGVPLDRLGLLQEAGVV